LSTILAALLFWLLFMGHITDNKQFVDVDVDVVNAVMEAIAELTSPTSLPPFIPLYHILSHMAYLYKKWKKIINYKLRLTEATLLKLINIIKLNIVRE